MAEILRVEDLTKYFATKKGTLHAVDGVTFGLREGQTLQQLYDERVPLYERYADITVDCENKSIREIVAEIAARLPK